MEEFANVNELWASVLVETLRRKGVSVAVTCPGSRSSPLTFAFAGNDGVEAIPVLDERSAGFFALGLAKRSGQPVALVCTSGSAVANFFPAVVEASESGVPLILLTADRPPELRDCGAGQTIDQVKVYGGYVRHQAELAVAEADLGALRALRQQVAYAVDSAFGENRGPAHLNVPFRDPLAPVAVEGVHSPLARRELESFCAVCENAQKSVRGPVQLPRQFAECERGLILVGACSPFDEEAWVSNVALLAEALQWPVLSDALNPLRSRCSRLSSLICGYESVLRVDSLRKELRPDGVIVIGSFPTSKALREWIGKTDGPLLSLTDRPVNLDPTHSQACRALIDFERETVEAPQRERGAYADRWLALEGRIQAELSRRLAGEGGFFEGKASWFLSRALPSGSALCVSNSMPPRDMEFYFGPSDRELSVYSSRGANGIDGILSTAIGVAHGGKPTYLLTGDLALLHDSNGGLLAKQFRGSLTILLVNNAGGGIFEMLPVAQFGAVFEKHFATDQEIDFADWARTYRIDYHLAKDWEDWEAQLPSAKPGIRLLELRTDRKADAARRRRWFGEIAATLQ